MTRRLFSRECHLAKMSFFFQQSNTVAPVRPSCIKRSLMSTSIKQCGHLWVNPSGLFVLSFTHVEQSFKKEPLN